MSVPVVGAVTRWEARSFRRRFPGFMRVDSLRSLQSLLEQPGFERAVVVLGGVLTGADWEDEEEILPLLDPSRVVGFSGGLRPLDLAASATWFTGPVHARLVLDEVERLVRDASA